MTDYGMLSTPEAYHLLMRAFIHVCDMSALIGCYKEMGRANIEPTTETYHVLLDGFLESGSLRDTTYAVIVTWRLFKGELPRIQPDVDLMNKFIRCCRLCQHYERAFLFLGAFNSFGLAPDFNTFEELLEVGFKVH